MSLAGWPKPLIDLATGRSRRASRRSGGELEWGDGVVSGDVVALAVQEATDRRARQLGAAAPLTLLLLRRLDLDRRVVQAYLRATLAPSPHLVPEGLQFLEFVGRASPRYPHLATVVALERCALHASSAPWAPPTARPPSGWLDRDPRGAEILTDAAPGALLGALVSGAPLPPEAPDGEGGSIVVGPGLEGRFRVADGAERRVLDVVTGARPYVEVVVTASDAGAVRRLVAAGVLAHRAEATPHGAAGTGARAWPRASHRLLPGPDPRGPCARGDEGRDR